DLLSFTQRHNRGDGCGSAATSTGSSCNPQILELRWVCKPAPDSAEITRHGVTTGALRFEISSAGAGIAHQHIERDRRSGRWVTLTSGGRENAMDVFRYRTDVVCGE